MGVCSGCRTGWPLGMGCHVEHVEHLENFVPRLFRSWHLGILAFGTISSNSFKLTPLLDTTSASGAVVELFILKIKLDL